MKRKKRSNNKKMNIFLNVILLFGIPCLIIGSSVAKYISDKNIDMIYNAKDFYFESDLLKDVEEQVEYEFEKGVNNISFYLKNNEDNLRFSQVDVDYNVDLTKNGNVIDTKVGTLLKDTVDTKLIEFYDLEPGEYVITAEATKPYSKKLTGKFNLIEEDKSFTWELKDFENSPVVELTVNSEGYEGTITITYPIGVQPDNADYKLKTVTSSYVTSDFNKNSSYTYTFFKNNPVNVFKKEDFTVSK